MIGFYRQKQGFATPLIHKKAYKKEKVCMIRVSDLIKANVFELANSGDVSKSISTPFCCDLLSIAMSRIPHDSAWVTIMGNVNTIAVASLADVSCIILAEGVVLDENSKKKALEQDITVFYTDKPIFEAALIVNKIINHE